MTEIWVTIKYVDISSRQLYLHRPHIDRLLEAAAAKPIVAVVAGAGYGKTHAVRSYVQQRPFRLVWLNCTEKDNAGYCFWENFAAAMRTLSVDSAEELEKTGFPSTEQHFHRYLKIPLASVDIQYKYIFVYDDFHLLRNPEVLRFMEKSITTPFSNITSILISRTEIPLNLMGYDAKGLVAKISQEDLIFSMEEMRSYLGMRGIHPTELKTKNVYHLSGGWPFAIRLSADILAREQSLNWNLGNCGPDIFKANIFKLIEKEIVSGAPPELRKFLVKLSLLNVHQAELLREIGGEGMTKQLGAIGTFISLDTYTDIYHVHPLLRDYLRSLEGELRGEEKQELYLKAASWCFAKGQKINALEYYDRAEDYRGIYRVMSSLPLIVSSGEAQILLDIMARFPGKVYETSPELYSYRARYLLSLGRCGEAQKQCIEAIGILEERGDGMTNPHTARALLGLYSTLGLIKDLRSQVTGNYSFAEDAEKAHRYYLVSGFVPSPPIMVYNLGSYLCRVGKPGEEEMEKYLSALSRSAANIFLSLGGCTYGLEELARAECALYKGQFSQAEELSHRAIKKAREKSQYEIENRALFFLLRIAVYSGSAEAAKTILTELENQLLQGEFINRFVYYDIITGWFKIQTGESSKTAPWLKNSFEESNLNSMTQGQESLVKARYHLAAREYPRALASLHNRSGDFGLKAFLLGRIESGALEAVCHYKDGSREESFAVFKKTCLEAREDALFMPFTELGRDMRNLTAAIMEDTSFFDDGKLNRSLVVKLNTAASIYAKRLLLIKKEFRREDEKTVPEELSPREWKTLTGLYQGLTGEEIAQETDLSINTVKSVIRRLYIKLGAANKADAIRIALEAGFLRPAQGGKGNEILDAAMPEKVREKSGPEKSCPEKRRPESLRPLLSRKGMTG